MDTETRVPEALIEMRRFIDEWDRERFIWVDHEEILSEGDNDQDRELRNHVKRKPHPKFDVHYNPFDPLVPHKLGQSKKTTVYNSFYAHPDSNYLRPLAIKIFDCKINTPISLDKAKLEVHIMQNLTHPHIVSYIASWESRRCNDRDECVEEVLGIVMYPPGTDLAKILEHLSSQLEPPSHKRLDEKCMKRVHSMFGFFGCLVRTLSYLHTARIQIKHKDVKPSNIIIDSFDQPLISDFGISAKYLRPGEESTPGKVTGTTKYAPPEAFEPKELVGYKCDVFSLGCVFLEMATLMLGVSLDDLHRYMKAGRETPYHKRIQMMQEWLCNDAGLDGLRKRMSPRRCGLNGEARDAILSVLPLISDMLHKDQNIRKAASDLWPSFEPLYRFTKGEQVCQECKNPPETWKCSQRLEEMIEALPALSIQDSSDEESVATEENTATVELPEVSIVLDTKGRQNGASADAGPTLPTINGNDHSEPRTVRRFLRYVKRSPALPMPNRRSTTLSLVRRAKRRQDRKILIYDDAGLLHRREGVYIGTMGTFSDRNPMLILPIENMIAKRPDGEERDGILAGHLDENEMVIDLTRQGFRVLWRALLGVNKNLYIRGAGHSNSVNNAEAA